MAAPWLVIALSSTSALAFAGSSAFKHASAAAVPNAQGLQPGRVAALMRATITHKLWLAGIGCDAIGLALQVLALHLGRLSVVQPLMISGLLYALIFRRLHDKRQVSWLQLRWAVVVCAALAAFLIVAGDHPPTGPVDRMPAVIAGVMGGVIATACIVLGRRLSAGGLAAAVLGVAVGVVYAATAALLKSLTDIVVNDPSHLALSWQLYLTVVLGATGLVLNQVAFQAGPLAASLPATASVDPLASVAIGVVVYDEHVGTGGASGIPLVALLFVLGIAVVKLARSTVDVSRAATGDGVAAVG